MNIYTHTQESPLSTWTINHNLGCKPAFDLFVLEGGVHIKAYPASVVHVSDNLMQLSFSTARTGKVRLVGTPL